MKKTYTKKQVQRTDEHMASFRDRIRDAANSVYGISNARVVTFSPYGIEIRADTTLPVQQFKDKIYDVVDRMLDELPDGWPRAEVANGVGVFKLGDMLGEKKQYTKKQIQEAISYWEKQLAEGNYRKVNEAEDDADAEDAAETAIAALDELAGALDPEYEDPNSLYLSFTGKDDYYSKLDRISGLLTRAGLKYSIDYPEDDDDDGWASVLVHVRRA